MSTLLTALRPRPEHHHPDAGLPAPALAMTSKAHARPNKARAYARKHGPATKKSVDTEKKKKHKEPEQSRTDIEAQTQTQTPTRTPLRVRWARFKKRIGTGSNLSDSIMDGMDSTSAGDMSFPTGNSAERGGRPESGGERPDGETKTAGGRVRVNEDPVDDIVVDNVFLDGARLGGSATHTGSHPPSEQPHQTSGTTGTHGTGTESVSTFSRWDRWPVLRALRWRLYPAIVAFFHLEFFDEECERSYRKEVWYSGKTLAFYSGIFYIFNWILACAIVPRPWSMSDKIFYPTLGVLFSFPIPFLVAYDWPYTRSGLWQVYITCATAIWAMYQLLYALLSAFYSNIHILPLQDRDFIGLFYYIICLQFVSMFGLRLNRISAVIVGIVFILFSAISIVPFRSSFIKNDINLLCFEIFTLYMHYKRETAERRLFSLRDQLKVQFRATQKAQVSERKEASSKRRLTSYIFHEVRVPLNTALLAVQNMKAVGAIGKEQEQDVEFAALEGSLSMMSKVLNDVLDFNRMDSGRFESVSAPYAFHTVMRSMFVPLRLAADARGLELTTTLDPRIDEVSRRAAYQAQGHSQDWIRSRLNEDDETGGLVVGDEMRLRQIVTNLASNACKFTQPGGHVSISTRLLYPAPSPDDKVKERGLSTERLSAHNRGGEDNAIEQIVVHIEVTDTGVGIRARDLVDLRLFSPYVQTEIGRHQGGKGTGLGLALIRHIVKLSGGRLGVKSKIGCGSTFWVELPLGVGKRAVNAPSPASRPVLERDQSSLSIDPSPLLPHVPESVSTNSSTLISSSGAPIREVTPGPITVPIMSPLATSALRTIMEQGAVPVLSHATLERAAAAEAEESPRPSLPDDDPALTRSQSAPAGLMLEKQRAPPPLPRRSSETVVEQGDYASTSRATHPSSAHSPSSSAPGGSLPSSCSAGSREANFEPDAGRPLRVLVVDDDPLTRTLMSRLLARLGCQTAVAENGLVALEQIMATPPPSLRSLDERAMTYDEAWAEEDERFSVVFLDNQMPIMSGLGTIQNLREAGRQDLVVGVTGNALLSDQNEYLEAGADHVLTKPVKEASLKHMLETARERRLKRISAAMQQ